MTFKLHKVQYWHLDWKRYNIDGTDGEDIGWSFCCTPCVQVFLSWPYFILYPVHYSFVVVSIIPSLFYPLFIPVGSFILSLMVKRVSTLWLDNSFNDGIILMILCSVPVSYFLSPLKIYWVNNWWDTSDDCFFFSIFILYPWWGWLLGYTDDWWDIIPLNADDCSFQCFYYFSLFCMGTIFMEWVLLFFALDCPSGACLDKSYNCLFSAKQLWRSRRGEPVHSGKWKERNTNFKLSLNLQTSEKEKTQISNWA